MKLTLSLKGIDQALENLPYRNPNTPKYRLMLAIRKHFTSDAELADIPEIPMDALIPEIWETEMDVQAIRARRKNFASLRTALNTDLKEMMDQGLNPEGVIIGKNNTFEMADTMREKLLQTVSGMVSGDGDQINISRLYELLGLVKAFLDRREKGLEDSDGKELEELKRLLEGVPGLPGGEGSKDSGDSTVEEKDREASGERGGLGIDSIEDFSGAGEASVEALEPGDDEELIEVEEGEASEPVEIEDDEELIEVEEGEASEPIELGDDEELIEVEEGEAFEPVEPGDDEELIEVEEGEASEPIELGDDEELVEVEEGEAADSIELGDDEELIEVEEGEASEPVEIEDDEELIEVEEGEASEPIELGDDEELVEVEEGEAADSIELGDDEELIEVEEGEASEPVEIEDDEELIEVEEGEASEPVELGDDEELIEVEEGEASEPIELGDDEELIEVEEGEASEPIELGDDEELIEVEEGEAFEPVEPGDDEELIEVEEGEASEPIELGDDEELVEVEEGEAADSMEIGDDEELIEVEEGEAADSMEPGDDEELIEVEGGEASEPMEPGDDEELIEVEEDEASEVLEMGEDEELLDFEGEEGDLVALADDEELMDADEDIPELPLEEEAPVLDLLEDQEVEEVEVEGDLDPDLFEELVEPEPESDPESSEEEKEEPPELGLPFGSDEDFSEYDPEDREKNNLLSERFDGYLGAMERFYNQYPLIQGGGFTIGSPTPGKLELKAREITLPDFYMGRFPVTNALFEVFVERTGYRTTAEKMGYGTVFQPRFRRVKDPVTGELRAVWQAETASKRVEGACWYAPEGPGSGIHGRRNHPVVQVSLEDARRFAAWIGKRLPSEEEWEAAARTAKAYPYPWGESWNGENANVESAGIGETTAVDAFSFGRNMNSLMDLLGNVMEWTQTPMEGVKQTMSQVPFFVAKGGSFITAGEPSLWSRYPLRPDFAANIVGFRCLAD